MKKDSCARTQGNRREFLKTVAAAPLLGSVSPLAGKAAVQPEFPDLARLRAVHDKQGIIPPNKTYRMMEWEFHKPPDVDFSVDWQAAMKAARDAGAESMMFYSQDHWGYAHYSVPKAVLRVNSGKLDVKGAKMVWPSEKSLVVKKGTGESTIELMDLPRYTALWLRVS